MRRITKAFIWVVVETKNSFGSLSMKKTFVSLFGLAFLSLAFVGCGTPQGWVKGESQWYLPAGQVGQFGQSPNMPIAQSSLPPDPVRRSSSWINIPMGNGDYSYSHDQGTDNTVSRTWGPYGPDEYVGQRTWKRTHESFSPRWYYPPPQVNVSVHSSPLVNVPPAPVIPALPPPPQPPVCVKGTIHMVPLAPPAQSRN